MTVTEFSQTTEKCTASVHLEMDTGEAVSGPIHVGFYLNQNEGAAELWIDCEGRRINLPERHIADILKQIKRALKMAQAEPQA